MLNIKSICSSDCLPLAVCTSTVSTVDTVTSSAADTVRIKDATVVSDSIPSVAYVTFLKDCSKLKYS